MKKYKIVKLEHIFYDYLIIATTYISPISMLDKLQKDLGNVSGRILFDSTLIHAFNNNRYISATIENGVINRKTFQIEKDINDALILKISKEFFLSHPEIVENGVISKAVKNLLTIPAI